MAGVAGDTAWGKSRIREPDLRKERKKWHNAGAGKRSPQLARGKEMVGRLPLVIKIDPTLRGQRESKVGSGFVGHDT